MDVPSTAIAVLLIATLWVVVKLPLVAVKVTTFPGHTNVTSDAAHIDCQDVVMVSLIALLR